MRWFPSRRLIVGAGLAAMVAPATPAGAAPVPDGSRERADRARALARARDAYRALDRYFDANDGTGLVREQYPPAADDRPYAFEWPHSQVHIAALDLALADRRYEAKLAERARGQEHYWNTAGGTTGLPGYASYPVAPHGSGGDMFYDDNEWVGLAKVQLHLQTGDKAALRRAEEIFALVESGWDTDADHSAPGGVFWTQAPWSQDRNTVSNMPGAQLALRLHQITGEARYLRSAARFYDWTNQHLRTPDHLYWDHIDLKGTIEKTIWSYNQGVPVGVGVLLYQATGEPAHLREAERVAEAAYAYFVAGGRLFGQPVFFNSIFFKNLLLLESVTGGTKYQRAMTDYADSLWSQVRDADTGLVRFNSAGTTQAIEQAAFTQIYAVLAWPRDEWPTLY
ncbi:glycoside hydrolase family 76 protein [Streptomyces sp. AcE210]|uniref:glycoside hydrolase family 76 protein n=1 Tax=Streptomyces sp. AcE210 TaxID=2292703 RepID=UPI000E3060A4|nr:glycoside hydrolase family 76 protein [Streptomyces sp. AcE210]RFC77895.1 glycosyl hydrolase [Streptomyces sp. AcE210]